jgi:TRAP-type mannitol/chloroaromatic compound transport system substrate-binding protein
LARRIEQATSGRYRISIAETAKNALEALRDGDADLVHGAMHDHVGHHPAYAYFSGLPTDDSLAPAELEAWLTVGGGQSLWDALAAEHGLKSLLAGHTGPKMVWSTEPLDTPAAWVGRRVLIPGLGAEVARGLGAEPVDVAPREVRSALAEGRLHAAEYGGIIATMSAGVPAVAPHALASSLGASGTALSLSLSQRFWNELTDEDKAAFASASAEEFRIALMEERTHREPIAIALRARRQLEMSSPSADLHSALSRIGSAMVAHAAGTDAHAARINASYMAFRARIASPVA